MALAQDLAAQQAGSAAGPEQSLRFSAPIFGMARHMLAKRAAYYDALNAAQKGTLDVTAWVLWFVQAFAQGCIASQAVVRQAVDKAAFRARMVGAGVNARQVKVLERLMTAGSVELGGGFLGGLTADKYTKLAGTSKPTATCRASACGGIRNGKVQGVVAAAQKGAAHAKPACCKNVRRIAQQLAAAKNLYLAEARAHLEGDVLHMNAPIGRA